MGDNNYCLFLDKARQLLPLMKFKSLKKLRVDRSLRALNLGAFFVFVIALLGCVPVTDQKSRMVDEDRALESFITLGMAYLKQGDRDNSRRNFEKALEIDKNSAQAQNGMGLLYQLNGEEALAEQAFTRALREDKNYTDARVNYGIFLYQRKRFQEAYDIFEKASQDLSYDRRAQVLAYVGQVAVKLGNLTRAKSAFEHSLNINSKLPLPLLELAEISFQAQDYASAKRYLDRYSEVAKPSARSLWLGIRIERIFGNKDKEASYVLALKNLHPYSKEYLEYKRLVNEQAPANASDGQDSSIR